MKPNNKQQALTYTTTEEVAMPAEPSRTMGIRQRDWMNLRKLISRLSPGANKWELVFSSSLSIFLSFLFPTFSTPGVIEGWKLFFLVMTCGFAGVSLVSLLAMRTNKADFKTDKAEVNQAMDELESMYEVPSTPNPSISSPSTDTTEQRPQYQSLQEEDLYPQVLDFTLKRGTISSSAVQRYFRVGYARAARLVQQLEDEGVVGPADGARPRGVIVDTDSLKK
jgi:hypothetical protein